MVERILRDRGLLYRYLRDDKKAGSYLDRSLEVLRTTLGDNDPEVLDVIQQVQEMRGRFVQAVSTRTPNRKWRGCRPRSSG
ncbi:MAG: hypothetical protein ACR2I2_03595 [Bryobacteraceae bacterium]